MSAPVSNAGGTPLQASEVIGNQAEKIVNVGQKSEMGNKFLVDPASMSSKHSHKTRIVSEHSLSKTYFIASEDAKKIAALANAINESTCESKNLNANIEPGLLTKIRGFCARILAAIGFNSKKEALGERGDALKAELKSAFCFREVKILFCNL